MKKFVLSLVAALAISPVMAEDSVNLAGLGLGGLQPVSEAAGMEVRGLSSSAQGFSMAVASALIIDPPAVRLPGSMPRRSTRSRTRTVVSLNHPPPAPSQTSSSRRWNWISLTIRTVSSVRYRTERSSRIPRAARVHLSPSISPRLTSFLFRSQFGDQAVNV